MLNRSLCANFVAAELPEHLLLVVVRLNAPAELVELERVNRHMLGAGVAEPFVAYRTNRVDFLVPIKVRIWIRFMKITPYNSIPPCRNNRF